MTGTTKRRRSALTRRISLANAGSLVAIALLTWAAFAQQPGMIIADTKLDLAINPGGFLSRALGMWEPLGGLGQLQNQAFGYLFPMGPFFWLGYWMAVPAWVIQRAWMALLLAVAFRGTLRLGEELGIGSPATRLAGALAYALSPPFVTFIGAVSAVLVPAALAPWVLLPLVRGSARGSPLRAGARSGAAVTLMGGINAASVLAVLPLPALWLVTRRAGQRRNRLAVIWLVAVACGTAWWVIPLMVHGRYGLNFLYFTERANATTLTTSVPEVLRGAGHWLQYLNLREPWLEGGWALVTSPALILATAAVTALGMYGLSRRDMPERAFMVLCVVAGTVAVAFGYGGRLGGPFSAQLRWLLDGPLGAFRNVYKFEPVLRVPLALGLAHALARAGLLLGQVRGRTLRNGVRAVAWAGVLAMLVLSAAPFLRQQVAPSGAFRDLPDYWWQAAGWLEARSDRDHALIVPASSFGEYAWGRPLDEPMQPLAGSSWAVRDLIPLGGVGSTRLMDGVEERLSAARPSPGLAPYLARAGIRYLVVRNDLDWRRSGAPRPMAVRRTLGASPGMRLAASFGPALGSGLNNPDLVADLGVGEFEEDYRAVEIYEVEGDTSPATNYAVSDTVLVTGGPESLLQLEDRGLLGERPALLVADEESAGLAPVPGVGGPARWAVTDGFERRDVDFGLVHYNYSYPLAPDEWAAGADAPPRDWISGLPTGHQAVADVAGAGAVTASSYSSWMLQLPELRPEAAFDGNPQTSWVSGAPGRSEGEWVQIDLDQPVELATITLRLLADGPWRPAVTEIEIATEAGTVRRAVAPVEEPQQVEVVRGHTRWVRVSFTGVEGDTEPGAPGAGIRELTLPGVVVRVGVLTAAELGEEYSAPDAPLPVYAFDRGVVDPFSLGRQDEELELRRVFELPRAARMRVTGTATPVKGPDLDRLIATGRPLQIAVTSSWNELPEFRGAQLFDGLTTTSWIAGLRDPLKMTYVSWPGSRGALEHASADVLAPQLIIPAQDPRPRVTMTWPELRALSEVRMVPPEGPAAKPERLRLSSPYGDREFDLSPDGTATFEPLVTDRMDITFPRIAERVSVDMATGVRTELPVGAAELEFPELADIRPEPVDLEAQVHVPCGQGPPVVIDGREYPTEAGGTYRDLVYLKYVGFSICDPAGGVELGAGNHLVEPAGVAGALRLETLTLDPVEARPPPAPKRAMAIRSWNANEREIELSPGAEAFLAVRENFNKGWEGYLDGQRLKPVQLDGWQQGWLLPAGDGGEITLRYEPEGVYRFGLGSGAVLAIAVVAIALFAPRRPRRGPPEAVAIAGPGTAVSLLLMFGSVFLLGGWAVLALPLVIPFGSLRDGLARVAGGLYLAAGLVITVQAGRLPGSGTGAFGWPAQLLGVLAVGALAAGLLPFARNGPIGSAVLGTGRTPDGEKGSGAAIREPAGGPK